MNVDEASAEQLGCDDRRASRPNLPFANAAILAECEGAAVGAKTRLLHAYSRGWHNENHRIAEQALADQGFYDVEGDS
ncbi:hypothetical protein EB73_28005 [Mycobacterium sp. SWH-M3]|nr:hypothetical protein EB73_28005 [Mycobacterium sp. SWH-M3]